MVVEAGDERHPPYYCSPTSVWRKDHVGMVAVLIKCFPAHHKCPTPNHLSAKRMSAPETTAVLSSITTKNPAASLGQGVSYNPRFRKRAHRRCGERPSMGHRRTRLKTAKDEKMSSRIILAEFRSITDSIREIGYGFSGSGKALFHKWIRHEAVDE